MYAAKAPVLEYIAPAPAASCAAPVPTVFAAPAPVVEDISPAPTVFAVPAPVGDCVSLAPEVSYAAPASVVEYISSDPAGYATPTSIMEYIRYAGPAPYEEKYFISMTRLEEENYAALVIQRGWRRTRKRIVIRAAWEERLQEKLWEARRRFVARLPVGASAKKKTESLREMQSTLKAAEKEWRKPEQGSWRTWNLTSASSPEE